MEGGNESKEEEEEEMVKLWLTVKRLLHTPSTGVLRSFEAGILKRVDGTFSSRTFTRNGLFVRITVLYERGTPVVGASSSRTLRARCPDPYRGYSKLRTHTALGPYGGSMPRSIGPSYGRCVSSLSSNPCIRRQFQGAECETRCTDATGCLTSSTLQSEQPLITHEGRKKFTTGSDQATRD